MSKNNKRSYSLTYLISQAFKSLTRNSMMTVASVAVLMSCLLVMGTFSLLVLNINYNLDKLGDMNQLVVYCKADLTEPQIEAVGAKIRAVDNVDTQKLVFKSKKDVFNEEKEKYSGNEKTLAFFIDMEQKGQNPYPGTFIITYEDASKVEDMEYELTRIDGVDKVKSRADLAESIESLKNGVIFVFLWFLVILFVVSIFVIINTIKLAVFSRRQEISIMRYVGATRWFITTPFIFEGIIIGLFSSLLSYFIQWYAYTAVVKMVAPDYTMLSFMGFEKIRYIMLAAFVGVGVVTGVIGSVISLRKYLRA